MEIHRKYFWPWAADRLRVLKGKTKETRTGVSTFTLSLLLPALSYSSPKATATQCSHSSALLRTNDQLGVQQLQEGRKIPREKHTEHAKRAVIFLTHSSRAQEFAALQYPELEVVAPPSYKKVQRGFVWLLSEWFTPAASSSIWGFTITKSTAPLLADLRKALSSKL